MPRFTITHPSTGKRLQVEGPVMPSPGMQRLIFARHHVASLAKPKSQTRDLYTTLVEQVLPEMNAPMSGREVAGLLKNAGADDLAQQTDFADWLKGQKMLTRGALVSRLMNEAEFRSLLGEHAGTHGTTGGTAPVWQTLPGLVQNVAKAQSTKSGDPHTDAQVNGVTSLAPSEEEARKGDGT